MLKRLYDANVVALQLYRRVESNATHLLISDISFANYNDSNQTGISGSKSIWLNSNDFGARRNHKCTILKVYLNERLC